MSSKLKKIMLEDKIYLFQNYGDRLPVCFTGGEGACLFDQDNKRYIDFFSGIAVSSLGYAHKALTAALHKQVDKIIHSSNWYYNTEQITAGKLLSELSFPGKTIFTNSGAEANEAAIKLARRYGLGISKKRYQILSFANSFHGRTMGSMTATAQKKIHANFGPLVPGFKYLPFNNIEAFAKEVEKNSNITAVFIELIQGEAGIITADKKFVRELGRLCNEKNILIIVDEIQTGIGRTGKHFGFQNYDLKPDIITLAKGLAGGVPIGALHAKENLSGVFTRGSHGTTFGGNHLACAGAVAVLKEIKKPSLMNNVNRTGQYIFGRLHEIRNKVNYIKEVRGMGLHIGIELTVPGMDLVMKALEKGLVINCTAEKVIRIMPPLTIPLSLAKEGMKILEELLLEVKP